MSTDRFNPEPTDFTPAPGDADLIADPDTGAGPAAARLGEDGPAGDVNATAGGDAPADDDTGDPAGGPRTGD